MAGLKRHAPADAAIVGDQVVKKRKQDSGSTNRSSPSKDSSINGPHKPKQKVLHELTGSPSATSREAHAKQKTLAKERKAAKPNADSIQRAKKLWERLRLKSHVEKEERDKLVAELFTIVTGNVKDFVFKHDSVRTVQCAIKYANKEQRHMIARELQGEYKNLAESRYAKFLVAKLLVSGDTEVNEMIISEFYGHVRRMINHPEASWILDDTYRQVATPRQKAILLREWYGPEFSIFRPVDTETPNADLVSILEESPEKRKPIMRHLHGLINQLVQKKMAGFTMLHDAMLQYSLAVGAPASSEAAAEFIELLKDEDDDDTTPESDLLKNLGFTKSGSRVISRALALTTAKDRKLFLRAFKDNISDLAHDPYGSAILLAAYESIDDTKLTAKSIISDLLASKVATLNERYDAILEQALHPTARIPLLYPFVASSPSDSRRLLGKDTHASRIVEEVRELRTQTSKKDPETRRAELARALSGDDGTLLATIAARAAALVATPFGCQFVTEVLLGAEGSLSDKREAAMVAVADLAEGDPDTEGHIARSAPGGRMLKTLVTGGKWDAEAEKVVKLQPRLGFAEVLYERIKDWLVQWAVGDSSFVVCNLAEDSGFAERDDVIDRLTKGRLELKKAAQDGNKGAIVLLQ